MDISLIPDKKLTAKAKKTKSLLEWNSRQNVETLWVYPAQWKALVGKLDKEPSELTCGGKPVRVTKG